MLNQTTVTVRELSKLIGTFASLDLAVLPAKLYYRNLQLLRAQTLRKKYSYESATPLNPACEQELRWWISHLQQVNGREIKVPPPHLIIDTDDSLSGWGAVCQNQTVRGLWTQEEKKQQINTLELRAILFAARTILKDKTDLHVHFRTDNVTAAAHVNKMGGTRSEWLTRLAQEIWEFCLERRLHISAEYIPGSLNGAADSLSREKPDSSDWQLNPETFQSLIEMWGHCQTDLFASRWNTQLTRFMSYRPADWGKELQYAFPPFCLIGRCLEKIRRENAQVILVTPTWHTQSWYGQILAMLVDHPILLPPQKDLLRSPQGEIHPLIANNSLHLAAWRISGDCQEQEAFQKELPNSLLSLGSQVLGMLTAAPGKSGVAGVTKGKLIRFKPL